MVQIVSPRECCGCGACVQACPKECITLAQNREGFLYPHIDQKICIDCGACVRACPAKAGGKRGPVEGIDGYAAYAKDAQIREGSSSGGVFSLLASWVLARNGVVVGAAFDKDFSVHHVMVDTPIGLAKLRGSKYLQSRIENTYQEVRWALEAGKTVLFSGTPCQIAGLRAFLKKPWENLFCVDVICHGVPSPKIWMRYLEDQKSAYGSQIRNISFRDKTRGWKCFSAFQEFEGGSRYSVSLSKDPFMQMFLSNVCLRPSCYSCRFKGGCADADITLGDAWGIETWMPEMDDDHGTSAVLLHTAQGRMLWEAIAPGVCSRRVEANVIIRSNIAFSQSAQQHPGRKLFFAAANCGAKTKMLMRLSRRPLWWRALSFGKRCIKKMIRALSNPKNSE